MFWNAAQCGVLHMHVDIEVKKKYRGKVIKVQSATWAYVALAIGHPKKSAFHPVFAYLTPLLVFSSNISNFK